MFKCANCDNAATVVWCPPAGDNIPYCADHRPSFTFKPEYIQHINVLPLVGEPTTVIPAPNEEFIVDSEEAQAPSEAPAEETPKEAAPKKEPKK